MPVAVVGKTLPIVSVDVPDMMIDVGLKLAVRPVGTLGVKETVPVKAPTEVTVMELVPEVP